MHNDDFGALKLLRIMVVSMAVSAGIVDASAGESAHRDEAEALLKKWCDGMIALQISTTGSAAVDGAVVCPACGFLHARICDAVHPFTYMWVKTGDRAYLTAAERVLDWAEANYVRRDGSYWNDRKTPWKGTTVFCQIAIGRTLLRWGERLGAETAGKWRKIFDRQTGFIVKWMNNPKWRGVINYPAAYCESMALAWKLTGEERYRAEALRVWREMVLPAFTTDGLLSGEGQPMCEKTAVRGLARVDIGYNLEESLPALGGAAELLGSREMLDKVKESARAHMAFVLPDGGIDNSFGSRSVKWTYWGSRTSDGALPLYGLLARGGDGAAASAAERTVRLLSDLTGRDGLLYGGLRYADAGEPACVHHTFAHAKALAEYLSGTVVTPSGERLPRETHRGLKTFPSVDVTLASVGPWLATFSASDSFPKRADAVGGGCLSLLWHRDMGPVLCATMPVYRYVEYVNQQDQRHAEHVRCMAARIVSGEFTNLSDYEARVSSGMSGDDLLYSVSGRLTSLSEPVKKSSGYEIRYALSPASLSLAVKCDAKDFSFMFPVVVDATADVSVKDGAVTVSGRYVRGRVESSGPVSIVPDERGKFSFSPIAGVLAVMIEAKGRAGEELRLSFVPDGTTGDGAGASKGPARAQEKE